MIHPTPTKVLLATTLQPLVVQLSGLLARGTRLLDRFVHAEPTPEITMAFERDSSPTPTARRRPGCCSRAVSIAVAANIRMSWARSLGPSLFGAASTKRTGTAAAPYIPWSYVWGSKRAWPHRLSLNA